MEKHFSRITDARRLKPGDLMVIPSEAKIKKKRLHMSISTYREMGLSVGDTTRAENSPEAVSRLLGETGSTRTMVVYNVQYPYCSNREAQARLLLGNVVNKPEDPVITSARFMELPPLGVENDSRFKRLFFLRHMMGKATEVLNGRIPRDLFFRDPGTCVYGGPAPCEELPGYAFESKYVRPDGRRASLSAVVPATTNKQKTLAEDGSPIMMDPGELGTFLSSSRVFNSGLISADRLAENSYIMASCKFFENMSRRGARFYRPDAAFYGTMMAYVVGMALQDYETGCLEVLLAAKTFATKLKAGTMEVKDRIATAKKLSAQLLKEGRRADVCRELKEVTEWHL